MIFYIIVAIILGLLLIFYGISLNVRKEIFKSLPIYILSFLYIGLGIYGFFINSDYEWIIIIALILLCVISLVVFKLLFPKKIKS